LLALGQVFLISACELLKPWPLKIIIDNVLSNQPLDWIGWAAWTRISFWSLRVLGW